LAAGVAEAMIKAKKRYYKGCPMDILETRQLLAFTTIVETGGFTKAARKLHLTQSALSHQIKSLETQLHAAVFARLGKRVVLQIGAKS